MLMGTLSRVWNLELFNQGAWRDCVNLDQSLYKTGSSFDRTDFVQKGNHSNRKRSYEKPPRRWGNTASSLPHRALTLDGEFSAISTYIVRSGGWPSNADRTQKISEDNLRYGRLQSMKICICMCGPSIW